MLRWIGNFMPPVMEESEVLRSETAAVEQWTRRVRDARDKWTPDFKRMKQNMEFAAGLQWAGQKKTRTQRYVCNMTIQMVNQKVATLYARNPQVSAKRRKRMDFRLWDGDLSSIQQALMRVQQSMLTGIPDVEAEALLRDYQQGRQFQELVDKVGQTLEYAYQYQTDNQEVEFKEQMKQLVTTVIVCGVGYVRPSYVRDVPNAPMTDGGRSMVERARSAQEILRRVESGELDEDSAEVEQLRLLVGSFGVLPMANEVVEGLKFDFPDPTSIIPDPRVKSLNEFTGARWIAQEYMLPLREVNSFFETEIQVGTDLKVYSSDGVESPISSSRDQEEVTNPTICLWEVMDISTKSHFFIVDGHKKYVMPPEAMTPKIRRFWPVFGLTFNRVLAMPSLETSPFPPSDVELVYHPQKEWNRSRDALRAQRRANAPKYVARKGLLTEDDKAKLDTAEPNQVVELEGLPPDTEPGRFLSPMAHAPIDPLAYDTNPIREDFMLASRLQEANMGAAQPDVTATGQTIAEQSRQSVASSNVDDLDGLLSRLAEAGGEMLLREMPRQVVERIAGIGAVWPEQNREDFINEIYLEIEAASSGRPNKALEIANFERIAPLLLQAGANPLYLVQEGIRRLDDRADVNKAFPLVPSAPGGMMQPGATPEQPLQQLPSEAPVPLPGA